MPITLYGVRMSPPYRAVLLTARTLGVDIVEKQVDFQKLEHKSEAFLKINPTHTVPALDDNGFHMWESRAMMGYLAQQYGKDDHLYPKEPKKRAVVDNMLFYDADCLFSALFHFCSPVLFLGQEPNAALVAMVTERIGFLDTILADRKFAAGDHLTIADLSLLSSVSAVEGAQFDLSRLTNVRAWRKRVIAELPFYDEINREGAEVFRSLVASKMKNCGGVYSRV